ncbi:transposase [Sneathia sanguinegens]|uniref:transposase n=1 Tax=Sneathia sanguinegens TaxID=40543 RepID=UPI00290BBE8E|nr:transposase [Sneathia sanguinegens]MDU7496960.1 transposase [Sneathia sanguinegens]
MIYIYNINKRRWQIEEFFRIFKNKFKARPVYVRTKESIESHFLICFLALLIYRILEKKLEDKYTCREIIDTLRSMTLRMQQENIAYSPNYTRTKITAVIHKKFSFRTDSEAIEYSNLKKIKKQKI